MLRTPRFPLRGPASLLAAGALILGASGCQAATGAPSDEEGLRVVASTSVYSSLVAEVLGDRGSVEALVTSANQDPHSYEASAHDKLKLSKANLVVLNGGGYDAFAETIVDSLPQRPSVLEAFEGEGHSHGEEGHSEGESAEDAHAEESHAEDAHAQESGAAATEGDDHAGHDHAEHDHAAHDHGNEHVWYDLHLMGDFVEEISHRLGELDPEGAAGYAQRAEALRATLSGLEGRVEALKSVSAGRGFVMTEPVAQSLLEDAGLSDATPEGLAEAIEEGDEISPLALKRAKDALASGDVAVLAYNSQTTDEQTVLLRKAATDASVPVLEVGEAAPEGQSYTQWMDATITELEGALK